MNDLKKLAGHKIGPDKHNIEDVRVNEESSGQRPKRSKAKRIMKMVAVNTAITWLRKGLIWLWENCEDVLSYIEEFFS